MTAPPGPARERSAGSAPLAGLEWLKLLASLGIVAFHLQVPGHRIGYAGLPVFALLTAALAARSANGRAFRDYRAGRLRRLLLPWLAWSALYAILQCLLASLRGQPTWSWPQWSMLVIGTYPHLWYLPFAAAVTLAIGWWVAARARPVDSGGPWPWTAAGLLAIPLGSRLLLAGLPEPLPQWAFVLPGALLGLGLARVHADLPGARRTLAAIAGLTGATCAATWLLGWLDMALPYAAGIAVTAIAWAVPAAAGRFTLVVTRASFGVYVLHPLVALAAALALQHAQLQPGPAALLALVFGGSLVLAVLLRLTPARRIL